MLYIYFEPRLFKKGPLMGVFRTGLLWLKKTADKTPLGLLYRATWLGQSINFVYMTSASVISRNKLCNSIKLIDINCRSRRIVVEIPLELRTIISHNTGPRQNYNNSGISVCCVFCVVSGRARSQSFLCQHREMSGWSHNLAPKQRAPLLKGQGAPALLKQGQLVAGDRPGTKKNGQK